MSRTDIKSNTINFELSKTVFIHNPYNNNNNYESLKNLLFENGYTVRHYLPSNEDSIIHIPKNNLFKLDYDLKYLFSSIYKDCENECNFFTLYETKAGVLNVYPLNVDKGIIGNCITFPSRELKIGFNTILQLLEKY
jgi:hypothetical protein